MKEFFDSYADTKLKCSELSILIKKATKVIILNGAGISTSAGIPDFRGPNGIWTNECYNKNIEYKNININKIKPTYTH